MSQLEHIEAMESIEGDYENLRGVLPKSEYQELDNGVLGQLLRTLNPDELKRVSGDVFGRIYEYFLTQFADQKAYDGGMTHAGAWLLCDDISRYTLRAGVTCALFRGTTNVNILDRRDFSGDLYSIYVDCMAYMQSRFNTALIPHARGWMSGWSCQMMPRARRW